MNDIFECDECKTEVNAEIECFSWCSKCKKNFCCNLKKSCFSDYHQKNSCIGTCLTIINPKWIVNLRSTINES